MLNNIDNLCDDIRQELKIILSGDVKKVGEAVEAIKDCLDNIESDEDSLSSEIADLNDRIDELEEELSDIDEEPIGHGTQDGIVEVKTMSGTISYACESLVDRGIMQAFSRLLEITPPKSSIERVAGNYPILPRT